jgi:hypothetical protein
MARHRQKEDAGDEQRFQILHADASCALLGGTVITKILLTFIMSAMMIVSLLGEMARTGNINANSLPITKKNRGYGVIL